jgi:Anti-sigma factor NepR
MSKSSKRRPPKPQIGGDGGDKLKAGAGAPFPVHEHVGRHLKALFDDVTSRPIPDKFVKLLEGLERKQGKASKGSK